MCVCAHSSNRSAKEFQLVCSLPDMCVLRNTHMCMPTAAIGRPALEPWVQPSIDFFCNKHMCVCPQQQLACQSVECSEEPSLGFFIGLACNTNVCAHSSSWSTKQQSVCQRVSIGWFCTRHVWSEKHTCVCPQQQLVGQPLALGCNPQWTASATHMCVCAHSSNWSAKVVERSEPSLGLLIELFCKTHVCVGSNNLSAYPQLTSCATHVCVCSQQQPSRSAKVFQYCPSFN